MPKRTLSKVDSRVAKRALVTAAESGGDERLAAFREKMAAAQNGKGVDAYIIPSDDPHGSEYVAECYARREFISQFTGSAGTAVVTKTQALLWTDGRYFLQAEKELGPEWTLMRAGLPNTPDYADYLASELEKGARVGIDPNTIASGAALELKATLEEKKMALAPLEENLVDAVWGSDRPPFPDAPLRVHPLQFAGVSVADKLATLRQAMAKEGCSAMMVSSLDEIAWLLNVRGGDIAHCPVTLAFAVVEMDKATLYTDQDKVTPEVAAHLAEAKVSCRPYDLKAARIDATEALKAAGGMVWVDPDKSSLAVMDAAKAAAKEAKKAIEAKAKAKAKKAGKKKAGVEAAAESAPVGVFESKTPLGLAKALKNEAELAGMREAHLRDSAAMAQFFAWLEAEVAAGRSVTEAEVGLKLIEVRGQQEGFIEESFPTIAGAGPNGAIIHYRAIAGADRSISADTMLLLDSGAQYDCGTTDVTRTMHLGEPSDHQCEAYTRVLQGNIGLDQAVFPSGLPGFMLDSFARKALWQAGLDYRHGTGHGVGAGLNVHEGPQGISPRYNNTQEMLAGMIVSNEPGYYEDGSFGIRIENLLVVSEQSTANNFGGVDFLGFNALTLIPIQAKMIKPELLAPAEVDWINAYHAKVWEAISPRVEGAALEWLRANTQPLTVAAAVAA